MVMASESNDKDTGYASVSDSDDYGTVVIDGDEGGFVRVSGFAGPMDLERAVAGGYYTVSNWEVAIRNVLLKGGSITEDKALIERNIGVSVDVLEDFINNAVRSDLDDESNLQQFIHRVKDYYMSEGHESNLYDPQKRFMLTYMLKYLEEKWSTSNPDEKGKLANLYGELIETSNDIDKKIFEKAIENADDKRQNFLRRILALIQFSDNYYNYSDSELHRTVVGSGSGSVEDGLCKKGIACSEFSRNYEYPTPALAHGETVVINLPESMKFEEFLNLIGLKREDLTPRTSTHSAKKGEKTDLRVENKTSGVVALIALGMSICKGIGRCIPSAIARNISEFLSKIDFKYGIDVPTNQFNPSDTTSARGHFLISFSKGIAIIKMEDCGSGKVPVTGHGHGASGKSNYISATSHLRIQNPYVNRLALICDLMHADKNDLMEKVGAVADGTSSVKCTKAEFGFAPVKDTSLTIPGVVFHRYVGAFNTYYYGYIINNLEAFRAWLSSNQNISEADRRVIVDNNNTWLYYRCWTRDQSGSIRVLPEAFLNVFIRAIDVYEAQLIGNQAGAPQEALMHNWASVPSDQSYIRERVPDITSLK